MTKDSARTTTVLIETQGCFVKTLVTTKSNFASHWFKVQDPSKFNHVDIFCLGQYSMLIYLPWKFSFASPKFYSNVTTLLTRMQHPRTKSFKYKIYDIPHCVFVVWSGRKLEPYNEKTV